MFSSFSSVSPCCLDGKISLSTDRSFYNFTICFNLEKRVPESSAAPHHVILIFDFLLRFFMNFFVKLPSLKKKKKVEAFP